MKPHEKLGIAIADAGYEWTPEMRSAWEELDKELEISQVIDVYAGFITGLYEHLGVNIPPQFYPDKEIKRIKKAIKLKSAEVLK